MMGDPSKATNETFLQGTSTKDGVRISFYLAPLSTCQKNKPG